MSLTTMPDRVSGTVREFIRERFLLGAGTFVLGDEDSLLEKGVIDSTGVLELVTFIEERFGFKLRDEELTPDNLDSVAKLSAFIEKKTAGLREEKAS